MKLETLVERAAALSGAYGNFRTAPELVDAETIATARCQLAYQAIELFIHFCYHQSDNGYFINLAGNSQIPTGVWTPWGSSGKSQLTHSERRIVRAWLLMLKRQHGARPLFFYVPEERRWHIDTFRYPTLEEALTWLGEYKLTPKTWLNLKSSVTRRNRSRNTEG
jgi:hypothetical protein